MGSTFCCFNVKDPAEEAQDNIENANHNETPGFFPKLYNKIKEYAESSNKKEKDVENSSSESGSTQEEYVSTVQSPDLQGSNLEQHMATSAPVTQRGFELNSNNLPSGKKVTEIAYFYPPIQHEDECPTCLEEYTPENPKKTMQCSHNFHLACIYEWMERSHTCPICCRVMLFDEIEAS